MSKMSTSSRQKTSNMAPGQPAQKSTYAGENRKGQGSRRQIDWEVVRQRINQNNANSMDVDALSDEALQAAWERRTRQLAAVVQEDDQGEQIEIAVVRLGRELYGLAVEYIFDIRPLEGITRVPRVPDWVAGVVNLRGRVLSVLDLQRFLGLPVPKEESSTRHLVLVQVPDMELALLADAVLTIESLPINQIQEATGVVRGIPAEYVQGMVSKNGEDTSGHNGKNQRNLLVLLNLPALLADPKLIIHEDIV